MNISEEIHDVPHSDPSQAVVRRFVSEAAYFRAEKRGFAPGFAEQDWLEAEKQIEKEFKSILAGYYDFLYMR